MANTAGKDSAYDAMLALLKSYGLESLGPAVMNLLQDGYTQDQVSFMIQDTPEYKERFAGNEARRKKGIPVLSPRDYLSVESAYRQILSSNGLPKGFYDSPSDFSDWIGKDVAPTEIANRVSMAVDEAQRADPNELAAMKAWHGVGVNDLAAFYLDQDRALPLLQKISKSARIGGVAMQEGLQTSQARAEQLAGYAGERDPAQLMGQVAQLAKRATELSGIYGGQDYLQANAEAEVFQGSEKERRKRQALVNMEEANFSGTSGVGKSTLSKTKNY